MEKIYGKCLTTFSVPPSLYPAQNVVINDNEKTVVTANLLQQHKVCAPVMPPRIPAIPETHAVADTGATSVFVMTGTPMSNICPTTHPLTIDLPDGKVVKSTHVCDMVIPGLPTELVGHIVSDLQIASLLGIRILCKARCIVVFLDMVCYVKYKGKIILTGIKDPSTDLWTLPITPAAITQNAYQGGPKTAPGKSLP